MYVITVFKDTLPSTTHSIKISPFYVCIIIDFDLPWSINNLFTSWNIKRDLIARKNMAYILENYRHLKGLCWVCALETLSGRKHKRWRNLIMSKPQFNFANCYYIFNSYSRLFKAMTVTVTNCNNYDYISSHGQTAVKSKTYAIININWFCRLFPQSQFHRPFPQLEETSVQWQADSCSD